MITSDELRKESGADAPMQKGENICADAPIRSKGECVEVGTTRSLSVSDRAREGAMSLRLKALGAPKFVANDRLAQAECIEKCANAHDGMDALVQAQIDAVNECMKLRERNDCLAKEVAACNAVLDMVGVTNSITDATSRIGHNCSLHERLNILIKRYREAISPVSPCYSSKPSRMDVLESNVNKIANHIHEQTGSYPL